MNTPYWIVEIEYPHEWTRGYSIPFDIEEDAREFASTQARGTFGDCGYRKVTLTFVEEIN